METIQQAFLPANVFFTVLMLLMLLYWIMVVIGTLDIEFLDFDLDVEGDADVDVDGVLDGAAGGFFDGFCAFFYIGTVPVTILVSMLIICMWFISIIANGLMNPSGSMVLGFPIAVGIVIVSPFVCKVVCMPLKKLFSSLKKTDTIRDVIGRICTVKTTEVSTKMGQAEVPSSGAPVLINVVSDGSHVFHKGDEAVVLEKDNEKGVYVIAPVNLED